jgi:hypothetical protein
LVQYRRNFVSGGTYFFTLALADRRQTLLTDQQVGRIREASSAIGWGAKMVDSATRIHPTAGKGISEQRIKMRTIGLIFRDNGARSGAHPTLGSLFRAKYPHGQTFMIDGMRHSGCVARIARSLSGFAANAAAL